MGARPELVCFDMAGTTVIDDGQVPQAFVAALAAHGIAIGEEDIRNVRGAAKRQAILDLLPPGPDREEKAARALATFRDQLARLYRGTVREIPGRPACSNGCAAAASASRSTPASIAIRRRCLSRRWAGARESSTPSCAATTWRRGVRGRT